MSTKSPVANKVFSNQTFDLPIRVTLSERDDDRGPTFRHHHLLRPFTAVKLNGAGNLFTFISIKPAAAAAVHAWQEESRKRS
jgi:hypothetical protein